MATRLSRLDVSRFSRRGNQPGGTERPTIVRTHHFWSGTVAVSVIVAVGAGCSSSSSESENPAEESTAPAATVAASSAPLPVPPAIDADVSLDFSLEALNDDDTPWLLSVIATSNTDKIAVDHDDRILQRWSGDDWEAIAVIPFDLSTPGELVACDLDGPCDRPAVDEPLPPRSTGRERVFRLRPLEDGTYRIAEMNDRGYTVDSNRIAIEKSVLAD